MKYKLGKPLQVLTIESRSGAWGSIEENMQRLNLDRVVSLESFFAVAQMALSGFGHGLVPIGVANTLGIADGDLIKLPRSHASRPTLTRPVRFVARKSMFAQALVRSFYGEASAHAAAMDVD